MAQTYAPAPGEPTEPVPDPAFGTTVSSLEALERDADRVGLSRARSIVDYLKAAYRLHHSPIRPGNSSISSDASVCTGSSGRGADENTASAQHTPSAELPLPDVPSSFAALEAGLPEETWIRLARILDLSLYRVKSTAIKAWSTITGVPELQRLTASGRLRFHRLEYAAGTADKIYDPETRDRFDHIAAGYDPGWE